MNILIRCRRPPVVNMKQGIALYYEGATTEINEDDFNVSGFWQGQVERGNVEVVRAEAVEAGAETKTPPQPNKTKPVKPNVTKGRGK
jgi:hypothetical protein